MMERGIQKMSGNFGNITGMNFWNNFGQELSGSVTQQRMFRLARASKLSKDDVSWLSSIGIDSNDLRKIGKALEESSYEEGGLLIGNLDNWADQELADLVNSATFRDNRSMILQRGIGDVPVLMNTELGKTVGQFMTHAMVSHNRIFNSSLQRADKNVMMGLTNLVALGTLSYYLNELAAGREPSDDWRVWIAEGVDRSAIASVAMMINDTAAEPMGLGISNLTDDENFKKYDKRGVPEVGLGAINGYMGSVFKSARGVGSIVLQGEASKGDIKSIFSPVPFRLLPGLRQGFDGITNHLVEEYGE
tara:strand:- start:292 stop:1206 length:915 start_codon:yes stop_codon:yes gene_type:complete